MSYKNAIEKYQGISTHKVHHAYNNLLLNQDQCNRVMKTNMCREIYFTDNDQDLAKLILKYQALTVGTHQNGLMTCQAYSNAIEQYETYIRNINDFRSVSESQKCTYIKSQVKNLAYDIKSRSNTYQIGIDKNNSVIVCADSLKKEKVCLKHDIQNYMSDSEMFKMIALSILNESKTDNIRIFCRECQAKSDKCDFCKFENTTLSLTERENLKLLRENMWLEDNPQVPGKKIIKCRYLLKEPPEKLYHSKYSNSKIALESSIRLRNKLKKLNLLEKFHDIIKEEVENNFMEVLEPSEVNPELPIYFASINYTLITTAVKDKLRIVCNCSLHHRNKSLNENSIDPPMLLGDPLKILYAFRMMEYIGVMDLKAAFKSLYMCEVSNSLRSFWWIKEKDDEDFKIYRFLRVNFGSALSTIFLDLSRIKYVAKEAKMPNLFSPFWTTYLLMMRHFLLRHHKD